MACDDESAGITPLVSRSAAREALAEALKLYVGYRGAKRRFTMNQLVEGAGVKRRVIECAMEDPDSPEYRNIGIGDLLSLCRFLGHKFTNEWMKLSGFGAYELLEGQCPLPKVLTAEKREEPDEERKRLIRRLAELDGIV